MISREGNYFRAATFNYPEWIPVSVHILPATWAKYREALEDIVLTYPMIFGDFERGKVNFDYFENAYQQGQYIDDWGCVWQNVMPGLDGIVVRHPLPDRNDVLTFEPPRTHTGLPHGFMFMRLYYLRGFEELMIDFAEEPPELQLLIDKVLNYNMQELELLLESKPQIIYFGDDLGNQHRLPIHPHKWNRYMKPCYEKIFSRCHDANVLVYLHSDGHILEIIDSLIGCGVDILNPQVGANGLENLTRLVKGKMAVNVDLDRQKFPFWAPCQIDAHISEVVEELSLPEGGLMLSAEVGPDLSLTTINAICESLEKYRDYMTITPIKKELLCTPKTTPTISY